VADSPDRTTARPLSTLGGVEPLIWNGLSRRRFRRWMAWFGGSRRVALERVLTDR
jgi:hypothetical protein